MTAQLAKFGAEAFAVDGAPYIYHGKGDVLWSPRRPLVHTFGRLVFDCSGLVGWALLKAGYKDQRLSHQANTYYAGEELDGKVIHTPLEQTAAPEAFDLVVYVQGGAFIGSRHVGGRATHIEIVTPDGRYYGALRGDPDCRSLERAAQMRARVCFREKERLSGTKVYLTNPLRSAA